MVLKYTRSVIASLHLGDFLASREIQNEIMKILPPTILKGFHDECQPVAARKSGNLCGARYLVTRGILDPDQHSGSWSSWVIPSRLELTAVMSPDGIQLDSVTEMAYILH